MITGELKNKVDRLWEMLIDKDKTRRDLRFLSGISATMELEYDRFDDLQ